MLCISLAFLHSPDGRKYRKRDTRRMTTDVMYLEQSHIDAHVNLEFSIYPYLSGCGSIMHYIGLDNAKNRFIGFI